MSVQLCYEYRDGSWGSMHFETREQAAHYAVDCIPFNVRVWIDDDMVRQGFICSDERTECFL